MVVVLFTFIMVPIIESILTINRYEIIACVTIYQPFSFKTLKNYTSMASKSDNLRNLDFRAESPQTMHHNDNHNFLYLNILLLLKF